LGRTFATLFNFWVVVVLEKNALLQNEGARCKKGIGDDGEKEENEAGEARV
jgi:hypothetical protein